jgi:hypothetical protein
MVLEHRHHAAITIAITMLSRDDIPLRCQDVSVQPTPSLVAAVGTKEQKMSIAPLRVVIILSACFLVTSCLYRSDCIGDVQAAAAPPGESRHRGVFCTCDRYACKRTPLPK